MKHMNTPKITVINFDIRCSPDVSVQPRVQVHRWRTYPCDDEQVLVCELPDTGRIRVTTPIAYWDTKAREIVTQSGRVYELIGPMAEDSLDFRMMLMVKGI